MASKRKICTYLLRIRNAQLVTICKKGVDVVKGEDMKKVDIIEKGTIVVGHDGLIVATGTDAAMKVDERFADATYEEDIDGTGKAVLPGFVDGHTHPVWSGDRVHEFAMKLAGATYMEVHQAGGGIGFTVKHTRESSEKELTELFLKRLDRMVRLGTTVVEAKSGYGLDTPTEIKMLKVIQEANLQHPIDVVSNYCGAHSVPKGETAAQATRRIVDTELPAIMKLKKEGKINPELIDVFCEKGVFELADTKQILEAGVKAGLAINFHGDELTPIKASELAADCNALAISHVEHVSDEGMKQMANKGVIATLLPTTAYVLRIAPPPARKLIDCGVAVALGSDFNPNAHCLSMPHVMNLACVTMKMTLEEALVAATINSAASLKRSATNGSLVEGKRGDVILLDACNWQHITYEQIDPPIEKVFIQGKCAFSRRD